MDFKFDGNSWDRTEIDAKGDWYTVTSPKGAVVIRKKVSARILKVNHKTQYHCNEYYNDVIPWNGSDGMWIGSYQMDEYFDLQNGEWHRFPHYTHDDNYEFMDRLQKELETHVKEFDAEKEKTETLEDRITALESLVGVLQDKIKNLESKLIEKASVLETSTENTLNKAPTL